MGAVPQLLVLLALVLMFCLPMATEVGSSSIQDHQCIHDLVQPDPSDMPFMRVKGSPSTNKRQNEQFMPIRIHTVMDPSATASLQARKVFTDPNGPFQRALRVLSNTLMVRPIEGNVTIPPSCDLEISSGINAGKCYQNSVDLETSCGYVLTVPTDLIGTIEACSSSYSSCSDVGPDGPGVGGTDFILLVGAVSASYCGTSVLAFASSCAKDSYYRPSAGYFNLCLNNFNTYFPDEEDLYFQLILHEITHGLGFSSKLMSTFIDENLENYNPVGLFPYDGMTIYGLNSSKVVAQGQDYYGCPSLEYVALQNSGGSGTALSHWDIRILLHETMAPILAGDYNILSNFTLSYFEDSGWYKVNYTYTNMLTQYELLWGKDLGCDFVLQSCDNPSTYPYHCNHFNTTHQCTFDGVSKGECKQVYNCYISFPDFDGACIHFDNSPTSSSDLGITEVYGTQSRCFEHTSGCSQTGYLGCLATQVVRHNASGLLAYYINTTEEQVWCREGEQVRVEERFLTCPSVETISLRTYPDTIPSVDYIPPPLCHKNCSSCAELDDANQCLSCPSGSSLQGVAPASCSPVLSTETNITNCSCIEGDIRLRDGSNQYEGRVEICLNGEWGVVCDDGFGSSDAQVVCRQLGFDPIGAQALCCSYFGSGAPLPMTIDYLYCTGSESKLSECSHNGEGVSSCFEYEAAGVRCAAPCLSYGQVDIITSSGGTSTVNSGVVRVCNGSSRGVVCDNGWDYADASVACRAAGYSPYGAVRLINQYLSSSVPYPSLMNYVGCLGDEMYLQDCSFTTSSCSYYDKAGVTCQDTIFVPENCTHGDIRLVGTQNDYEGRVEVCINSVWGTICDSGWSSSDASVACGQLGFPTSGAIARTNAYFGQGSGPVLLSGLSCYGYESSLLSCSFSVLSTYCDHLDDVGVTCQKPCVSGDVDLVTSSGTPTTLDYGVISLCNGTQKYLVCDSGWDYTDARVACESAGYSPYGAVRLVNQYVYSSVYFPAITYIQCEGDEATLEDCSFAFTSSCYYYDYAGVLCQAVNTTSDGCTHGDIRLVGGSVDWEGRVEICINNVWGTICDSGWGSNDARTACQHAGFPGPGAIARLNAFYGQGTGPVFLSSVSCSTSASSLLSCSFAAPSSYCGHNDDAGVKCTEPCIEGSVELLTSSGTVAAGTAGIVAVCINQTRTVLCDYTLDYVAASIICKELGFSEYGAFPLKSQYLPGYPIGNADIKCSGNETNFYDCLSSSYSYCSYYNLAGLSCQANVSTPDNCANGDVRLVGGTVDYEGNVQICYNNLWGAICDSGWSSSDAQVVCRQLGYLAYGALPSTNSYFGSSDLPTFLSNVGCWSSLSSLDQCTTSTFASCDSNSHAGVRCGGGCVGNGLDLINSASLTNRMSGIVQICAFGLRGVVCDYNWDHLDARVVCKQLGFSPYGALATINQYLSSSYSCTLPDLLTNVNCTGQESNLSNCQSDYGTCSYYDTAGVSCQNGTLQPDNCTHGDIKLVGGNGEHEGTVHICINQVWGTICDSGWGSVDAGVVCQQLGYQRNGAQSFYNSYFGQGSGPVFITSVYCSSSNTDIFQCSYSTVSQTSYCNSHFDDAGVICEAPCEDEGQVDLITSSGSLSSTGVGVVRVCVNGNKGTVCDYGWGFTDASVACKAAGYSQYGAVPFANQYLSYSLQYSPIMSYVSCNGSETVLTQCSYSTGYCNYYNYAGVGCQSMLTVPDSCEHGEVRLAGSSFPWQGRVEVCINSVWGTVCDSGWGTSDARVVCSQVGYPGTGAQAVYNSAFGDGTAPSLINIVSCYGSESSLLSCSFSPPSSYCSSNNAAGVICEIPCTDGTVQLLQSSGSSGVVKLCDNSKSYLICDYGWDHVDASVACKSVGLSPYGAVALFNQYVSSTSGYSFLSYVTCKGSEMNLTECQSTQRSSSCQYNYAGIRCQGIDTVPDNCTHGDIRLVGGSVAYEGNVEICINGIWSTICDSGWSSNDARVACAQAGYPGAGAITRFNSYFGVYERPMILSGLGCYGSEASLLDCSFSAPSSSCDKYDIAGVTCEAPCEDGGVQLLQYSGSLNYTSGGVVRLCLEKTKYLVCDHGWDFLDARVLCQSIGYSPYGAVPIYNQRLSSTVYSNLPLLSYVECNGTESNLSNCQYSVLLNGYCNYNFAAVYCQDVKANPDNCTHGDIRLVGGASEYEGTVEICVNDIWGTVCDSSWSSNDASVVCSQLGYSAVGAVAYYNAWFGSGSGPILLSGLICGGYESSLLDCGSSIPSSSCDHFDDAGVSCSRPCNSSEVTLSNSYYFNNNRIGTLQICVEGEMVALCDQGWDNHDASVACRSLGFSPYGAIALKNQYISYGTPVIYIDFDCTGDEATLEECSNGSGSGSGVSTGSSCYYYNVAGLICQDSVVDMPANCTDGDLRLMGGSNENEGTVEICNNRVWSTICDNSWNNADAKVVCRQLGLESQGAEAVLNAFYGQGNGSIWLTNVYCGGNESNLLECAYDQTGLYCSHYEDAGVRCHGPCNSSEVTLYNYYYSNNTRSGILQICVDGEKVALCDQGWDNRDASVACRSLGFSPYGAIALKNQYVSYGTQVVYRDFDCTGDEASLEECSIGSGVSTGSSCYYYSVAGLICQDSAVDVPANCTDGDLRLVGGSDENEGTVEICRNKIWGSICQLYSYTSPFTASVICRQLNLPYNASRLVTYSFFKTESEAVFPINIYCYGNEQNISDCYLYYFTTYGTDTCAGGNDIGVQCRDNYSCDETETYIIDYYGNPAGLTYGPTVTCIDGVLRPFCDTDWTYADASVFCKTSGHSPYGSLPILNNQLYGSYYYYYYYYYQPSFPVYYNIECDGTEATLSECEADGSDSGDDGSGSVSGGRATCSTNYMSGVICQDKETISDNCVHGEVRLVDGQKANEGAVEICISNKWGSVCDYYGLNVTSAAVVCRQLGYNANGSQVFNTTVVSSTPTFFGGVNCFGNEATLLECSLTPFIGTQCTRVAVACPTEICPREREAVGTDLDIEWPQTEPGVQVRVPCPCSDDHYATRICRGNVLTGASWEESNTSECMYQPRTMELCRLSLMPIDAETKAESVRNMTSNSAQLEAVDIDITIEVIDELIGIAANDSQVRDDVLDTVQNLLNADDEVLAASEQQSQSASRILEDLEILVSSVVIPENESEISLLRETFALKAEEFTVDTFSGTSLSIVVSSNNTFTDTSLSTIESSANPTASIQIPSVVMESVPSDTFRIAYQTFVNDSLYQASNPNGSVNSLIISADVYSEGNPVNINGLTTPIELHFTRKTRRTSQCVFWDNGVWSTEGCQTKNVEDSVACMCNHLSSFTIITVDFDQPSSSTTEVISTPTTGAKSSSQTHVIVILVVTVTAAIIVAAVVGIITVLFIRKYSKRSTAKRISVSVQSPGKEGRLSPEVHANLYSESALEMTSTFETGLPEKSSQ